MKSGGLYYSDFHVDPQIHRVCLNNLKKVFNGDDLVSVTLNKTLDFGRMNIVLNRKRSYPTMVLQIYMGLQSLKTDYVYFLEHDCLYSSSHFDFVPLNDNLYFYNVNNYRWLYPQDHLITYSGLTSLSQLCCNRELALKHYEKRLNLIEQKGLQQTSRDPAWVRQMGYEPGTKRRKRGGITDEQHLKIRSKVPNIDIRHKHTFSPAKCHLEDFKHPPDDFQVKAFADVPEWDLKGMFSL